MLSSFVKTSQKVKRKAMVLFKLMEWVMAQLLAKSCFKAAEKTKGYEFFSRNQSPKSSSPQQLSSFPSITKFDAENYRSSDKNSTTCVCDINGVLLRSHSLFPYFMLVAFEGGSIFRAFVLLLSCPVLWVLDDELKMRVMIFISFCGLRKKDIDIVARAVLPKFYLENLNLQAHQAFASVGCRVVFTTMPRVMVEGFLKEFLSVDGVVGTELQTNGNFFTGLVSGSGLLVKHKALKEYFGDNKKPDLGLGSSSLHDHFFISLCKEAYVVTKEDISSPSSVMPREKYPKPLVFHDGRLAFLPTPLATSLMFMWLPIGVILAIFRILVGRYLPYRLGLNLACLSGVQVSKKGTDCDAGESSKLAADNRPKGVLYVCTHRTLLDPVFLCAVLEKPLLAVSYSLSKMSEAISPLKTVRLTRDRKQDAVTMERMLREGDMVICPEGTTCREPYLLRFSPLFAELADDIVPVALNTEVSMFYGTTASGLKCLDSIFFLMNPRPSYYVHVLGKLPMELTCAGGKSSVEVANYIQRQLADALGFECTIYTRKEKYLMLAGNEGFVNNGHNSKKP